MWAEPPTAQVMCWSLPSQPLLRDLKSQVAPSANALRFLPPPKGTFPRYHPAWGPVPFSPQLPLLGPREASPHDAGSRAEGRGRGVDPSLLCTSLLISKDLVPHSLLCSPEYDIEAAQEKDRQAFKPTVILQTQKTNCDGYAGLFERMCRYKGLPG